MKIKKTGLNIPEQPSTPEMPERETPMAIANTIIQKCNSERFLQDVVFYINAYLCRTYNAPIFEAKLDSVKTTDKFTNMRDT